MKRALALLLTALPALAQPLSERGAENLAAFARVYSIVRFFHPSDEAASADWNRIAVAGVERVEAARDAKELAAALQDVFRNVLRKPVPSSLPAVGWRHYGGHFDLTPAKTLTSERFDEATLPLFSMAQGIDARALRGRRLTVRASARSELDAELAVRAYRADGTVLAQSSTPLRDRAWRAYETSVDVAADADRVIVAINGRGAGTLWIDDVSAPVRNGGFDDPVGVQPAGWTFPYESLRSGYRLRVVDGECAAGTCARIESDALTAQKPASPDEPFLVDLGGGAAMSIPLALRLPHTQISAPPSEPIADSRSARLAATIVVWSIVAQLHPFVKDVPPLEDVLRRVALAPDRRSFRNIVKTMLAALPDERAIISDPSAPPPRFLPVAWEWMNGKLVVTRSAIEGLSAGDTIDAADAIPEIESRTPAATAAARRWIAAELLTAGPANSTVTLHLTDGREVQATYRLDAPLEDTQSPPIEEVRPGVLYVDLRRLGDADLPAMLPRLAAAKGIVFDLRGETDMSTKLLSHLISARSRSPFFDLPVFTRPDRKELVWLTTYWTIDPATPRIPARCAFLIDARAAGYTETLLAMIAHDRLGALVGEPSAGSNGVLNRTTLPGGFAFNWTATRVTKHDGSPFQGIGIAPTVRVSRTTLADEVRQRAIEIVSK